MRVGAEEDLGECSIPEHRVRSQGLDRHVVCSGGEMTAQAFDDLLRSAGQDELIDELVAPTVVQIGFGPSLPQQVVAIVHQSEISADHRPTDLTSLLLVGFDDHGLLRGQEWAITDNTPS